MASFSFGGKLLTIVWNSNQSRKAKAPPDGLADKYSTTRMDSRFRWNDRIVIHPELCRCEAAEWR